MNDEEYDCFRDRGIIDMRHLEFSCEEYAVSFAHALSKGYRNSDNIRYAFTGDDASMQAYRKRWEAGCCGFFEAIVRVDTDDLNGVEFCIGFNYGH